MTRAHAYMVAIRAIAQKHSRTKRETGRAELVDAKNFLIDDRPLEVEELRLLSHIFNEYGVHKGYPAFVDRIGKLRQKAEADS
jgi:hypothetical protein